MTPHRPHHPPEANTKRWLLNLGCGGTHHPAWTNIDFTPMPPDVLGYDLGREIPFPDNTFQAVYHSHLLEHLPKRTAPLFLAQCLRVLQPGGVLRLAVPDLEGIARAYLATVDGLEHGQPEAEDRHAWMVVELVDQLTRHVSGGEMLQFWRQQPMPAQDFVLSRIGAEARPAMAAAKDLPPSPDPALATPEAIGQFRRSGECHLWMYDRFSLRRLLEETGFTDIRVVPASVSDIPDFADYQLDVEADGRTRKPDSLFMEARKPDAPDAPGLRVAQYCMQHTGGAGSAALRLHQGLQAIAANTFLYVSKSAQPCPGVAVIPAAPGQALTRDETGQSLIHAQWPAFLQRNKALLAHYPQRPPYLEMFSGSETAGRISDIPAMELTDIHHLHWIGGTVDICGDTAFLKGRPLVWTLHDMHPITGGCHYAGSCRGFERHCGSCPQLGSSDDADHSRREWLRKKAAYRELDITVVCPSRWLAQEVQKSSLLGKKPVHVIPNGVPTDVFKPLQRTLIRQHLGLGAEDFVLIFGADAMATRRKGLAELLAALHQLSAGNNASRLVLLTFGSHEGLDPAALPCRSLNLGRLGTPMELALAYNAADCLLVPSLEDNLPNVVLEAMACGVPVAGFATGGIPDMVEDGTTGRLAPTGDAQALARCIADLRDLPARQQALCRLQCRETVLSRFTLMAQARAYSDLYRRVLEARR
ncbi:glycosyltransferase [Desulfovibrio sp. TomC]|uniref:glycosyltransferase n=1 Tax=Desulfovibrio sp. TomC TaxID=1562888 RepID=UPI0005732A1E|nr:glycosyltransferase [Desulfovibrio sp. TomC]KHK02922.1 Glycosyltransferase [Desulfovibrio sp. TomC]